MQPANRCKTGSIDHPTPLPAFGYTGPTYYVMYIDVFSKTRRKGFFSAVLWKEDLFFQTAQQMRASLLAIAQVALL